MFEFYEFFAGGGMARLGLGPAWRCAFANDIDPKKVAAYRANFAGAPELREGDVAALTPADLPGVADLAWASFPCQDLSLAGQRGGLDAERSGAFWPFWRLVEGLIAEGRAPRLIALENVCGALTSHRGDDFRAIAAAFVEAGYRFGALVIDAALFLPQSRPRLFVLGARADRRVPRPLRCPAPDPLWHPAAIREQVRRLAPKVGRRWVWWQLPPPPFRTAIFADLLEDAPLGVDWHAPDQTERLLGLMSDTHRAKVAAAQATGRRVVGGVYKRIRDGMQRAEVRFDDLAGCLRTPTGGSSRQTLLVVDGDRVRSRLLSPREAARLMGLPEGYALPERYNDAYHLAGDGLAVPVVRHLAAHLLEPLARPRRREDRREAA